jgi:hypothetical protein
MISQELSDIQFVNNCIDEYESAIIKCQEPIYMVGSNKSHSEFWKRVQKSNHTFENKLGTFYWHASLNISEKKPYNLQDRMILKGQRDKNSLFSCIPNDILSLIFQLKFKITLKHSDYIEKFYSTSGKKLSAKLKSIEEFNNKLNQCIHTTESLKLEHKKMENRFVNMCTLF